MSKIYKTLLILLFSLVSTLIIADNTKVTPNDINKKEKSEPATPKDPYNRRTPKGTVEGYFSAIAKEDYIRAGKYFNLRNIPEDERESKSIIIARSFKKVLDKGGTIEANSLLSDQITGNDKDNLDKNLDKVGKFTLDNITTDILIEKLEDDKKQPIWLFASNTVSKIPLYVDQDNPANVDKIIPSILADNKIYGSSLGHWLAVLFIIVASFILAWLLTLIISKVILKYFNTRFSNKQKKLIQAFLVPLRLWLAVTFFVFISQHIGISILVRQYFSSITLIIYWLAFLILVWQLTNFMSAVIENKMTKKHNFGALAAIEFCRRIIKIILIAAALFIILKFNEQDVSGWLAALGIGGIALALGAQKTIENIVGSISLIIDQPVRIGDFCQVGDTLGTIEQIGIRSTRIRTRARTIVTIPNGDFSSQKIENFSHRDNFWFHNKIGVRYETTQDQLRYLLVEIKSLLYAHPRVNNIPNRVRLIEFGENSLVIEIYAYIMASDHEEFLEVQEDLMLRIIGTVEESGSSFAFPSQTLYLAKDQGLSKEQIDTAEKKVQSWKDKNSLQIPKFTFDKINEINNTIEYPPEYSAKNK